MSGYGLKQPRNRKGIGRIRESYGDLFNIYRSLLLIRNLPLRRRKMRK